MIAKLWAWILRKLDHEVLSGLQAEAARIAAGESALDSRNESR